MIAHIEAQGSLLKLKLAGYKSRPQGGGGRRGIIRVFSRSSRLRLMRFLARLKTRKIRATFITLTFTEIVTNERAKKVFKRFAMRLRRAFPRVAVVWRMEFQERGAIHFHLLCFNMEFWPQKTLQETWEACTQEKRSIAHIKLIHGARSVMAYISKYIAKQDERTEITSLEDGTYQHASAGGLAGRFWGWINKELLPLGEVYAGVLTDRQTIRSLSSFAWSLLKNDNPYKSLSFHLFCENARWLCERAIEEGGAWLDEWEFTTRDHTTQDTGTHPYTSHFSTAELEVSPVPVIGRQSRASGARLVAPLTAGWLARSIQVSSAERKFPYFDEHGIVVVGDQYKQEFDHAPL
jgi:hypothetical protein